MKTTTWEKDSSVVRATEVRVYGKDRKKGISRLIEAVGILLMIIFSLAVFKFSGLADGIESTVLRVATAAGIVFWVVSSFRIGLHRRF
ncbi:MAG: hypothetical protein D6726_10730 [Nitrospirae bacterium]|nr:MAG: hypothetical protein D6726_10730 [Nitrospirota bacterium]